MSNFKGFEIDVKKDLRNGNWVVNVSGTIEREGVVKHVSLRLEAKTEEHGLNAARRVILDGTIWDKDTPRWTAYFSKLLNETEYQQVKLLDIKRD